jgi:hypothetical protein
MNLRIGDSELAYADCKAAFAAVSLVEHRKVRGYLQKHQIADAALEAVKRLPPALCEELLLLGAITAAEHYAREANNNRLRAIARSGVQASRENSREVSRLRQSDGIKAAMKVRSEKVNAFDRIIEMLDHHNVNGKPLGDCRRADLLRAATENLSRADDLTVNAALYKQLANMIGNGTVREYRDRAGIVALLTTTFEPAA